MIQMEKTTLTNETSIRFVRGVGEARYEALSRLGIETAGDLLEFFPRGYEERGRTVTIFEAAEGELCSIIVTVAQTSPPKRIKGGKTIVKCLVTDDTGNLELSFFNMPFISKTLAHGKTFRVYGRVKYSLYGKEMTAPKLEPVFPGEELPYYVPIYRLTPPLTQKAVASAVASVLPLCDGMPDILPSEIINKYGLMHRGDAVRIMHSPRDEKSLLAAKRTMAFETVSVFRLALAGLRSDNGCERACPLVLKGAGVKNFFDSLPFSLTGAQQRSVKEIFSDLARERPMARLLQGDVGSGKTAVAAAAIYLCVKNGYQACMMAPTEILAQQHKKTLDRFLSPFGIKTVLLVSGLPAAEKRAAREMIASGEAEVAVGTHALITGDTAFENCALVVTDEQHRFGVAQRAALLDKSERDGRRAHMLVMSATPIPRSLSLIIYGDLDVSLLDELPPGRQKIETRVVKEEDMEKVYDFIRREVASGGRAYIVCPLVEDSENTEKHSAESHFKYLTEGPLKGIPAGLIHGRLKQAEKDSAMSAFAAGETKILVSTTVIEVGVDVPEATVMLVENAESFGLSQLHQLRGRVGRGSRRSVCILVNGGGNSDSADRLRIMRDTSDGFKVAEADLQRRGPGDFFGERQSGEFSLAFSAVSDMTVLRETDGAVQELLSHRDDPDYRAVFGAAARFLQKTGGAKTVN